MRTQRILQATETVGQKGVFQVQRTGRDKMVFFLEDTVGGTFIVRLQGRAEPSDAWRVLAVLLQSNLDANGTLIFETGSMPEVSANVITIGGGAILNARLIS